MMGIVTLILRLLVAGIVGIVGGTILHITEFLFWNRGVSTRDSLLDEFFLGALVALAFLSYRSSLAKLSALNEQLQQAEDRNHIALASANIAIWEWDLNTQEQKWSEDCQKLLGLAPHVPVSFETFIQAVHPEDRTKLKHDVEGAIRDHRDHNCEFRVVWPDHSIHWQVAKARPYYDESGKPIRMIGIAMDIEDRKRSEEQLRLQAEILNALANAVVITDPDAHIQWANPAFTKLTGYGLDEVLSKIPRFLKSGRHSAEFYAGLWQTIKAGNVWQGELVNRRKDGTLYDEEMTITPVKDDSGSITHFVAIKRDITARKHLEERMRMLAIAVDNSSNLIAMTSPDLRIVFANPALLSALQCSREEIIGRHVSVMLSKNNPPDFLQQVANPNGWRGECYQVRKDGTDSTILLSMSPIIGDSGHIAGFIGIAQDVSERKRAERELGFKNALLQAEADTTLDGILAVDEFNRVILSNRRFAEIWGLPQSLVDAGDDAPLLQRVADQIEDLPAFIRRVEYLYDHPEQKSEEQVRLKDGRVLERYSSPMRDAKGKYLGRIWYFRDITERLRNAERVKLWSEVLDQSAEGIFILDARERIIVVNAAFERLTGLTSQEVSGKTPIVLRSERHDSLFYSHLRKSVLQGGSWRGEIWLPRNGAQPFISWLSISAVRDQSGAPTHFVAIFSDITVHRQDQERMLRLAHYDVLTDLPNRALLLQHLNQMTKTAERKNTKVAVIFLDLDHFKEVNDSLGHDSGDELLQTVAKRLSSSVRAGQDTVARMGGDEFVVLLPGLESTGDLATVAHKLLSCFLVPVDVKGQQLTVTASIGIAVYPDDGRAPQELIQSADAAMYQAKSSGRNNFKFYTSDLQRRAMEMLSTENGLRRAIDQQEFILEYQPQVSLRTGRLVGAEALIRWNRPGEGLVMPGQFIAIAEERGLIIPIGTWVIDEACRQAVVWQNSSVLCVPIAVNVSAVQFRQREFVDLMLETVRKHGISPRCLELELTEGVVIRDPEATAKKLKHLHDLGFGLSIDDFGTGYSSLSYLRRFSFDKIKIDRSFVLDENAANIVTAMISLSRSLKLKVIAEGVETPEQLVRLREQDCDEVQGYLIGTPVSAPEFEESVIEWARDFDPQNPFRRPLTAQKSVVFA
jgi:diguanylate cyclase (GGDEF)-like protein/PAS domain S-box-containing protein